MTTLDPTKVEEPSPCLVVVYTMHNLLLPMPIYINTYEVVLTTILWQPWEST